MYVHMGGCIFVCCRSEARVPAHAIPAIPIFIACANIYDIHPPICTYITFLATQLSLIHTHIPHMPYLLYLSFYACANIYDTWVTSQTFVCCMCVCMRERGSKHTLEHKHIHTHTHTRRHLNVCLPKYVLTHAQHEHTAYTRHAQSEKKYLNS